MKIDFDEIVGVVAVLAAGTHLLNGNYDGAIIWVIAARLFFISSDIAALEQKK